jgi:hypothetical protein
LDKKIGGNYADKMDPFYETAVYKVGGRSRTLVFLCRDDVSSTIESEKISQLYCR